MQWFFENGKPENTNRSYVSNLKEYHAVSSEDIPQGLLWISGLERLELRETDTISIGKEDGDDLLIAAVEQGSCCVMAGMQLSGGQAALMQQDFPLIAKEDCTVFLLSMSGLLVQQTLSEKLRAGKCFCPSSLPDIMQTVYQLEINTSLEEHAAVVYRLLMRLYASAEVYERQSGYPMLVQAAIGIIQEDFASLESVEEIAEQLDITSNHLIRLFTATIGISPGKYLRKRRLECAAALLVQPEMNVSLAAGLSGFSDANYFSKVFRKEFGVTPKQYRQAHRPTPIQDQRIRRLLDESAL